MGVAAFDRYTIAHFVWGCSSYVAVPVKYFGSPGAFVVANIIHLASEVNENDVAPDGTILESLSNHVADQASFAAGSLFIGRVACNDEACDDILATDPLVFICSSLWFWGALYKEIIKEVRQRREWAQGAEATPAGI